MFAYSVLLIWHLLLWSKFEWKSLGCLNYSMEEVREFAKHYPNIRLIIALLLSYEFEMGWSLQADS